MKYCAECSTPIEPEDQFCPECGTRLSRFRIGQAACQHCESLLLRIGRSSRCPRCDSYCSDCGAVITKGAKSCPGCKISFKKKPKKRSLALPHAGSISWVEYGGFLPRSVALATDLILVSAAVVLIGVFLGRRLQFFLFWVILLHMIYNTTMIGSKGSTLGMRLYSLRVVDERGRRITMLKSFYRYVVSIGSALSIGGGLMIGFHRYRQGLHDLAVNSYIVRIRE